MPRRPDVSSSCCLPLHLNEDNARFGLLAALILLYLLCGAVVFSALEHPSELRSHQRWQEQLTNFTQQHRLSVENLQVLLRQYEQAFITGIRVDALRPRWDFAGAFYFVGTVVSTIGQFTGLDASLFYFSPPQQIHIYIIFMQLGVISHF